MGRTDSLKRRKPRRERLPRVLIVCEGIQTEKGYFQALRHTERIPIELEILAGGTPKTLVEKAVKRKREADAESRRSGDPTSSFDEIWCVFDVDEHPYLPEARQQAADHHINVALSNPCFELWVLLHFRDQNAYIERSKVQQACRKELPGYEKRLPCDELFPRYSAALKRARQLDKWQRSRNKAGENPSTGVFRLVEKLKSFRTALV